MHIKYRLQNVFRFVQALMSSPVIQGFNICENWFNDVSVFLYCNLSSLQSLNSSFALKKSKSDRAHINNNHTYLENLLPISTATNFNLVFKSNTVSWHEQFQSRFRLN